MQWKAYFFVLPTNKEDHYIEQLEMSVGHTSPTELFEPYFDEDLIKLLINESILYAQQSNRYDFSCTVPEMKSFIGFPLFTGYH